MKVLLAEDDLHLGELIVHLLKKKGIDHIDWVQEGEDAYDYAMAEFYDVVVLDWMLPNGDGVDICRRLRQNGYTGAILILTAKDAVQDRVTGLEAGADDYLVKPFEIDELVARLKALARRTFVPLQEETVTFHGFTLNRTSHTLHRNNEEISLTPREFQLLDLLVQNQGQVVPRETILDRVWGWDADVSMKTIDATIKLLRKKLKDDVIQTVRGVGYKIDK
ncbi:MULTISPECIES: response regulator transcription factor [Geobacillus]|jgi:DNA-binding response OmpR family regulator|uniref:Response regulator transcription factor n=1 Tax=Geobacillus thermodenitrificans TaxID=33940 RepID=A0ABY9QEP8_GEOTD|nr:MULTISPECIES: response regulator transcription factor [Geobacillus]ARA97889.1 DNA-binding response regulator [Geobacillus thermodenitrificans]ARP41340.1 Response regulator ArlR [Geobacillus thermodenitrificans]ATO37233.1 DNA-binding response regulator [Geobacillus thermodenitrificans]KQB94768.1 Response regulator ArlR [Geobacillus sp. PA-3]MEC5189416.1 DNA-binding response OmpR family regulator [Geobacillus thermodenitrificans]